MNTPCARQQTKNSSTQPRINLVTAAESCSGWTVGVGGAYAFRLTGFVEYDFYGFGTRTNRTVAACGAVTFPVDIKENKNVFKVGLNLKWGPTAPLVGRY